MPYCHFIGKTQRKIAKKLAKYKQNCVQQKGAVGHLTANQVITTITHQQQKQQR